jgi:hypothetical protein
VRAAGSFGLLAFARAVHARTGANKRLVKNSPALICATPIRSLRTEWSRMENKAASASRAASKHRSPIATSLRGHRNRADMHAFFKSLQEARDVVVAPLRKNL